MRQGEVQILDYAGAVASTSPSAKVEESSIACADPIPPSADVESSDTFLLLKTRLEELETTLKQTVEEQEERKAALAELKDFETVKVSWTFKDFYAKVDSSGNMDVFYGCFYVAGHQLCLRLRVGDRKNPTLDDDQVVSLFFHHKKGGPAFFSIEVGGSKLSLSGNTWSHIAENASIKSAKAGRGWSNFTTLGALRSSCLRSTNDITVEGVVRVRRVLSFRLTP
jgi:hypothetical protein